MSMIVSKADYTYTFEDGVLRIVDLNLGGMSVTNAIEDVLADIEVSTNSPIRGRIIYRDSEGIWDEVIGWPGQIGFMPIGAKSQNEALKRILEAK